MTLPIQHARLTNIGPFGDVTVAFPARDVQTFAVVGSAGKTAFLRALALALVPANVGCGYPPSGAAVLSTGAAGGRVCLSRRPDIDPVAEVSLSRTREGREFVFAGYPTHPDHFVVAYGPHRNAPDQRHDMMAPRVTTDRGGFLSGTSWDTISSLFGERRLCSTWNVLSELHRYSLSSKNSFRDLPTEKAASMRGAYGGVTALLSSVIGAEVRMSTEDVTVGGRPLRIASDGTRGHLRWVTDMVARWIDRQWRAGNNVGPNFAAEMEGVCIVDALDESLSPRQQRCAISALRRAFPKVSFVVSVYAEPSIRPFGLDDIVMFDWRFDPEAATEVLDVVDAAFIEGRSTGWSW